MLKVISTMVVVMKKMICHSEERKMTTEDRVFNYIDELQDKITALEEENRRLRALKIKEINNNIGDFKGVLRGLNS